MFTTNKKIRLIAALLAVLLAGQTLLVMNAQRPRTSYASTFTDISTHWARNEIQAMADAGIVNGVGNGLYNPEGKVSVAEFSTMISRAFWADLLEKCTAAAKPDSEWWWAALETMRYQSGLGPGRCLSALVAAGNQWTEESKAAAVAPLTRYEMGTMIYQLMTRKGVKFNQQDAMAAAEKFTDWTLAPGYESLDDQKFAIGAVASAGILNGKTAGQFVGNDTLTRAEAAVVMSRLLAYGLEASVSTPATPAPTTEPTPVPTQTPVIEQPVETTAPSTGNADGFLANGKPITEENVLEIMAEVEKEYPTGMVWGPRTLEGTNYNPDGAGPMFSIIQQTYGTSMYYACGGFAALVSDRIFGRDANPLRVLEDHSRIRPGDTIVIVKTSTGESTHVATAATRLLSAGMNQDTGVGWPDNALFTVDGNMGKKVVWPDGYGMGIVEDNDIYDGYSWVVYTRYPESVPFK